MKELLKKILKAVGLYHPLQLFYRQTIFNINRALLRRAYARYRGRGFSCNVCGNSYSRFVPGHPLAQDKKAIENNKVIAGYGQNVFCPHCLSTARDRLVIAMLGETGVNGKKILHLSPEKNVYLFLKDKAEIITADLIPGFYKNVDKHIRQADATQLSFADDSFDMVIGNHIFEHIPDDRKAMQEIYRVLKPGGAAILQVPFSNSSDDTFEDPLISDPKKQSELFGQKDHVRIYSLSDYINRLRAAGFTVDYIPHEALQRFHHFAIQPGEGFLNIRK